MKCCASPTTSTAHSVAPVDAGAREAAAQFAALLMQAAFAPLAKPLGFFGDAVLAATAQALARSERGGLTDVLERSIRS